MADVSAVSGYDVAPSNLLTTASTSGDSLGKSEFLNLLVTQMKYQDPLEPTDDKEFIAQMAQFSSLEQMQNLNSSFDKYRAYGLVGKNIDAMVNGSKISGFVESININSSGIYAVVDGSSIDINNISGINDTAEDLQIMVSILENLASVNQKLAGNLNVNITNSDEDASDESIVENTAGGTE